MFLLELPFVQGLSQIVFKMKKLDMIQLDLMFQESQANVHIYDAVTRILTTISGKSLQEAHNALQLECFRNARTMKPRTPAEIAYKAILE